MSGTEAFDVVVVGGGIAGIALASELAGEARVAVLEREAAPGSHATGRSAAMLLVNYGNERIRTLTRRGARFFARPDPAFWPEPLLAPRGELFLARPGEEAALAAHLEGARARRLDPAGAAALVPILAPERIVGAAHDPDAPEIDVERLLQGHLRRLRRHGGTVRTGAEVVAIARRRGGWEVATAGGARFSAATVVNAAGAWADRVAALARVPPLGLAPLRRSAAILPAPSGHDMRDWPLFGSLAEDWYAKPAAGRLMVSPAEEDPVEPHDAWADDLVLAEGLARFEAMTTVAVTRVERSWAGLRTFAADRTPVAGADPAAEGFFWLAGQGGYGIQTAPELSRIAAAALLGSIAPADADLVAALDPARLRRA